MDDAARTESVIQDSLGDSSPDAIDSWDEYFQLLAEAVKLKSKDPKCQVGAVVVSSDNVVLATGFNGLPRGVRDRADLLEDAEEKFRIICHAEQNAITNAARVGVSLEGAKIYVTKFPCLACLNSILQAGVSAVYTDDTQFWNDDPFDQPNSAKQLNRHDRKRRLIREVKLDVTAPRHSEFEFGHYSQPKYEIERRTASRTGKPRSAASAPPQRPSSRSTDGGTQDSAE